jgi:hypothetical protein
MFQGQMELPHPEIAGESVPVRIGLVVIMPRKGIAKPGGGDVNVNVKSGMQVSIAICFPNQKDYFGFKPYHRPYGNFDFKLEFLGANSKPVVSGSFLVEAGDGTCLKYFATNQRHQSCSAATYISEDIFEDGGERQLNRFIEECIRLKTLSGGQFFYMEVLVSAQQVPPMASLGKGIRNEVCGCAHVTVDETVTFSKLELMDVEDSQAEPRTTEILQSFVKVCSTKMDR